MKSKGQVGVLIFLAFLVLVIAVILLIIFIYGKDDPVPVEQNVTNKTYYNISLSSNADLLVSYKLSNYSDVNGTIIKSKLVDGFIFPFAFEYYKGGVEANTTVLLEAFSDAYYYNFTICNVTVNDFVCSVNMKRKALDFDISLSQSELVIDTKNFSVQTPIVCFAYDEYLSNIVFGEFNYTKKPSDIYWLFDLCYKLNFDVVNRTVFPLELHRNTLSNSSSGRINVLVRDYELSSYNRIGDKNLSIRIS